MAAGAERTWRTGRTDVANDACTERTGGRGGKGMDGRADRDGKGADSQVDGRMGPMRRGQTDGQKRRGRGLSRADGQTSGWADWTIGGGRAAVGRTSGWASV